MTLKRIAKAWLAFAISLTTLALFCINASAAAKTTVVLVDETYSSLYFSYEPTVSEYLNNTSADIVRFGKMARLHSMMKCRKLLMTAMLTYTSSATVGTLRAETE